MRPRPGPFLPTAVVTGIAVVVIAVFAKVETYRIAPAFLLPILWGPLFLRRQLHLHPVHYTLFAIAVLLHCMGAFGYYQKTVFGISFDVYVHFYFAFAATFIVERFLRHHLPIGPWVLRGIVLLMLMGCGAIHELAEYVSYLVLGEERGMLKPTTSYTFDTQRDLLNNLLGTAAGLLFIAVARARVRPRS